mmetsp:Transcript_47454/g.154026  ORF Transcript_47454/g.154026 Transcript_47454/m.154026 type:complete len:106 (-) Transcript_47454:263-580(-)
MCLSLHPEQHTDSRHQVLSKIEAQTGEILGFAPCDSRGRGQTFVFFEGRVQLATRQQGPIGDVCVVMLKNSVELKRCDNVRSVEEGPPYEGLVHLSATQPANGFV